MGCGRGAVLTVSKAVFDPRHFLAHVGGGRSIANYPPATTIYVQGDAADFVFYIQKGKVKVTVVSEQGKEAVVAILGADEFFGEGVLPGSRGASRPSRP